MNSLENFINKNRSEFDSEEMKGGWEKISSKITPKKTISISTTRIWWAAAATVLLFTSVIVYFIAIKPKEAPLVTITAPPDELTNSVDTNYTIQMDEFVYLIKIKQTELKQSQKIHPVLYEQFLKDNNKLDSSYNYLKSKLKTSPNKEVLLDAMIQNLQVKLDILNRQLQIIKQSKLKKTDNENKTI